MRLLIDTQEGDPSEFVNAIESSGFNELKISGRHAAQVNQLPLYHRDPFDRLLIGQALVELMQLLTTDGLLRRYSKLVVTVPKGSAQ